ncbi:hypothetical protein [Bradyrhizobium sp. SSUT77]|uniref:hypothetical protein n=1 Tax=Bradyrhizobium sp. SSUT77 TaxID=3040603 RepID=UPI002446D932|nr:hypothetical protein [Bradyrhizobium sp. SSUT77]MDH2345470.1 hypothetical protein [Bradyrhizobium sp. SSUT77]
MLDPEALFLAFDVVAQEPDDSWQLGPLGLLALINRQTTWLELFFRIGEIVFVFEGPHALGDVRRCQDRSRHLVQKIAQIVEWNPAAYG